MMYPLEGNFWLANNVVALRLTWSSIYFLTWLGMHIHSNWYCAQTRQASIPREIFFSHSLLPFVLLFAGD
jgi:hypothetical protein